MTTIIETPAAPAGSLTDKEAAKIFRDAYSDIHKSQGRINNSYEAPSYEEPVTPAPVEQATPTPSTDPVTPVVQPEAQPATPEAAAPAEPPKPKTIEEIVKELPGEAQSFIQNVLNERALAEQRYRTTSGRLHKTRQEYNDNLRELAELRARVTKPTSAEEAQAKVDHAKSIDEWRQVIEAEPTLAKAVDALTDAKVSVVRNELTELQKSLAARDTAANETQFELNKQQEWDRLTQAVPNIQDVIQSQEYRYWVNNVAPPTIKKMAEESIDHRDALFVLQNYHPYAVALNEHMQKTSNPQPSAPSQPVQATTPNKADEIANQRNNKPVAPVSQGVPPINPAAARTGLDSAEAVNDYFEQAYKKIKGNK